MEHGTTIDWPKSSSTPSIRTSASTWSRYACMYATVSMCIYFLHESPIHIHVYLFVTIIYMYMYTVNVNSWRKMHNTYMSTYTPCTVTKLIFMPLCYYKPVWSYCQCTTYTQGTTTKQKMKMVNHCFSPLVVLVCVLEWVLWTATLWAMDHWPLQHSELSDW